MEEEKDTIIKIENKDEIKKKGSKKFVKKTILQA